MKYLALTLICVLFGAFSAFAQTDNKQKEPVSLIELTNQPFCGVQHIAQLEEAVKDQPNNAEFQSQREFCLKRNGDTDFIKVMSALSDLTPKLNSYKIINLNSLLFVDEITKSDAYLKTIFAALPDHWFPYAVQTKVKMAQKDYRGASDSWLKSLSLMPLTDKSPVRENFKFALWQITFDIQKLTKKEDEPAYYETFFNAAYQRQQKLTVRLKEMPIDSAEYKNVQGEINAFGGLARLLCNYWAKLAAQMGNTQLESAVLEKMVTTEPRWQAFSLRSAYYQSNGNSQKALADQVLSYQVQIESLNEEIKRAATPEQRLKLDNQIADQYSHIGDIYFRDRQYSKAISNYEKAKPFSRYQTAVERKINEALQKLNAEKEAPRANDQLKPYQKPLQTTNPNAPVKP